MKVSLMIISSAAGMDFGKVRIEIIEDFEAYKSLFQCLGYYWLKRSLLIQFFAECCGQRTVSQHLCNNVPTW